MKTPACAVLTFLLLLSFTGFSKLAAQAARVVEWVDDAPASDTKPGPVAPSGPINSAMPILIPSLVHRNRPC